MVPIPWPIPRRTFAVLSVSNEAAFAVSTGGELAGWGTWGTRHESGARAASLVHPSFLLVPAPRSG